VLIFLMLYRPRGIMGLREFRWFIPGRDLFASQRWRSKDNAKKEAADVAPV
jgi:branched-chain amino acid transport system permease protein